MKTLNLVSAVIVLLSGTAILSQSLPQGHFEGSGSAKSTNQDLGPYKVTIVISATTMKSHYILPDGEHREDLSILEEGNGHFKLLENGKLMGHGICADSVPVMCQFSTHNGRVEESLTFEGRELKMIGYKDFDQVISWQQTLEKK